MKGSKTIDRIHAPTIQTRFDQGSHYRAKIGYVLLATEQTIQDDVMRLRPEGVGIHFTRAAIPDSITSESLAAQIDLLAGCASTLLLDGSLDVIWSSKQGEPPPKLLTEPYVNLSIHTALIIRSST